VVPILTVITRLSYYRLLVFHVTVVANMSMVLICFGYF